MFEEKEYQPTATNRFYPGRISVERIRQLANFEVGIDDLTFDDILHSTARARTIDLHVLIDIVRQKWGADASREVAEEWARRRCRTAMEAWLKHHGVKHGSPKLMAMYQDLAHALGGPSQSTCSSEYDDEKCIIRRTRCGYHTFKPEGMDSVCGLATEGFMRGYMEADPALVRAEKPACLAYGDDYCERIFYYRK